MARTPHTSCWEGKRVKVKLIDGSWFVDKFVGKKGKYRFFQIHGKVPACDIKAFTIWKAQ